jgi:peptidoglycan-N-acetylglucosamine deacetylase
MKSKALGLLIVFVSCAASYAKDCDQNGQKSFLSRVVAIDPRGENPANLKDAESNGALLLLGPKEVVLTFDGGPHPSYTKNILDILDRHCVKATFFFAGSAAWKNPAAVRDAVRRGHTIAAAGWTPGADFDSLSFEAAKTEIGKGLTAVARAANAPAAPFVRPRAKKLAPDMAGYLKDEGIGLWPADVAAGDEAPGLTATKLANGAIARVEAAGKGVVQFHDTSRTTVDALDSILLNLKLTGFKVVHAVPAANFTPKDVYLAELSKAAAPSPAPTRASQDMVEAARRRARSGENSEVRGPWPRRADEWQASAVDRSARDARARRELAAPNGYDRGERGVRER